MNFSIQWSFDAAASLLHFLSQRESRPGGDATTPPVFEAALEKLEGATDFFRDWEGLEAFSWQQLFSAWADLKQAAETPDSLVQHVHDQVFKAAWEFSTTERQLREFRNFVDAELSELPAELELRRRPLDASWDTIGPGLIRSIQAGIETADTASHLLVTGLYPVCGGWAGFENQQRRFELMLFNPHPIFPENLRLGWLVAQSMMARKVASDRLPVVAAVATLFAAEDLGLSQFEGAMLAQFLEFLGVQNALPAETLVSKWEASDQCRSRSVQFSDALLS